MERVVFVEFSEMKLQRVSFILAPVAFDTERKCGIFISMVNNMFRILDGEFSRFESA